MTTNKPEVLAYHINKENPEHRGDSLVTECFVFEEKPAKILCIYTETE